MAEPLKNIYNLNYIKTLAQIIAAEAPNFDTHAFIQWVFNDDWDNLALKARMDKICRGLHHHLALPYEAALTVLIPASSQLGGGEQGDFASTFFPHYVATYGLKNFEASMPALAHFTQFSSAEFAVRPFIVRYPSKMMAQMTQWATSNNYYIRRLASEGCRPRLPWAMALPAFKQDPTAILPILELLKNDQELYVRRSVANNLNDIAKDNPQITINLAKQWQGCSKNTDWLIKHACRSLLKQGHPEALSLFGFKPPKGVDIHNFQLDEAVQLGGKLNFSFALASTKPLGKLRLEYGIDFMKSNGQRRLKVFQISENDSTDTVKTVAKTQSFKAISTRRYYEGEHGISIIVNGKTLAYKTFTLQC